MPLATPAAPILRKASLPPRLPQAETPGGGGPQTAKRFHISPPNRESTAPEGIGRCHTAAAPWTRLAYGGYPGCFGVSVDTAGMSADAAREIVESDHQRDERRTG